MLNKELKTLDFFLCDSVLDLGVFVPFSPKLPECSATQKTGITQSSYDLGQSKTPFDVKCGAEDYVLL